MTLEQKLANAMDAMQPRWAIEYADAQELRQFALTMMEKDVDRFRRGTEALRISVVRRLFEVIRAGVHYGIVRE